MAQQTSNKARRKVSASRRKSKEKVTAQAVQPMSAWQRYLLTVCIVVLFSLGFYQFFVRPYAYRWKPCYGMKGYGVCMPCKYEVHGIDVSHYQGSINWGKLANDKNINFPLHFVFMKATEGGDLADETFEYNFEQAKKYGFVRGAYHYLTPKTDALKQADFFISSVKLYPGDLPPVLDVEVKGRKSVEELQLSVKTWLQRVEQHYGVKPIIYTSYKFKERYLNDSIFNTYPYWIAHYYVDSVRYAGKWHFWQHTDVGTVPGVAERVDLNVFNGTLQELTSLCIAP